MDGQRQAICREAPMRSAQARTIAVSQRRAAEQQGGVKAGHKNGDRQKQRHNRLYGQRQSVRKMEGLAREENRSKR